MKISFEEAKQQECNRLSFIEQRDGVGKAKIFAKQIISQYRMAVLDKRCHGSLPQYRPLFIASYIIAKKYLANTIRHELLEQIEEAQNNVPTSLAEQVKKAVAIYDVWATDKKNRVQLQGSD